MALRTEPLPRIDPTTTEDMRLDPLRRVMALLATQYSVVAERQIRRLGVTWKQQQSMVRVGVLAEHTPGVLRLTGAERTWHQRAMAATLAAGTTAVLAGAAAARLHHLDSFGDVERIVVLLNDSGRVRVQRGVTVYRSRRLVEEDVEMVDGIPVTSIGVTLIHLAMHRVRTRHAMDAALRNGADPAVLRAVFERWRVRGVVGPPLLLQQLHERVDARLPKSMFQRIASSLLASHGIHMVDEWPIRDEHGRLLAELDLADVELQVGVECQSWRWHGTPEAQRRDARRKRMLARMGWDIIDLWWSDLERIDEVVADILRARERAIRLLAG